MEKKKDNDKKSTSKDEIENEEVKKEEIEISKEKLEKIEKELKSEKRKSRRKPDNQKLKKDIIRNILICAIITIYFIFIGLGVKTIPVTEYLMDLKTFSIFTVIITVVIFEKAYKKDENYLIVHGLEMAVVGIETQVLLNLYSLENENFSNVLYWIMIGMVIYYAIKVLIIYFRKKLKK